MIHSDDYTEIYPRGKKIILVGTFPPPLGGVSVYLKRLSVLLKEREYDLTIWDTSKGRFIFYFQFVKIFFIALLNKDVLVHSHALHNKAVVALLMLKKLAGISLFITNHNTSLLKLSSEKRIKLIRLLIRNVDLIVGVSPDALAMYKNYGIEVEAKTIIKDACLPPPLSEEKNILKSYESKTLNFIANSEPILFANAYQIVFIDNIDLYGLDLCVELTKALKDNYPNIGFVFALANEKENIDYLEKMKTKIIDYKLNDNFHFITGQKEIWPLFKKTDVMLRPTYSDGYSVSIEEAMSLGCKVIASDGFKRAKGTIEFKNRDLDDLILKTQKVLDEIN